jgi:hypothetical protein
MSSTTVLYVLEAGGNLAQALPQLAQGLDALRAKASATASTVASGLKGAMERATSSFKTASQELGNLSGGLFRMIAGFTFLALGTNKVLKVNDDWAQSTARLGKALQDVGKIVADNFGPTAAHFLDAFTLGFSYLSTLLVESVKPALLGFQALIEGVMQDPSVKALFDLLGGHPLQAAVDLTLSQPDLTHATELFAQSIAGFQKAQDDAIAEAKKVFGRATDGKSDLTGKEQYTDLAKALQPSLQPLYSAAVDLRDKGIPALIKAQGPLADAIDALQNMLTVLSSSDALKGLRYQNAADHINGAVTIAQGGISGIASAVGGPIGALVAALLNAFDQLPDLIQSLSDQALEIFVGLPGKLGDILGTVLPDLIVTLIPQLVQGFALLPFQITEAFLKAMPSLLASLIELLPDIALAFADAMERMLSSLFSPAFWLGVLRAAWADLTDHLKATFGSLGSILGTHLGANAAGHRSLFGVHLPKLDDGGIITRTGMAIVHKGEQYLGAPGSSTARATAGRSGPVFNIASLTIGDIRSIADALRRQRGSFGTGLRIDAYGG